LLHGAEISALCRGSVVLLSSHIEAYIKELGEHTLDSAYQQVTPINRFDERFFYYVSQESIERIRSSAEPAKIASSVKGFTSNDLHYWHGSIALSHPIPSDIFNSGFSNPSFDKVKAYFGRFGYTDFRRDFMRLTKRHGLTLESSLNTIVTTRNAIAHGDPTATKTPTEIGMMEQHAKEFCRAVDTVFSDWCRGSLCKIR
jgi:hypothetical protein